MFKFGELMGDQFVKDPIPLVFAIISTIIGVVLIVCVAVARHTLTGALLVSVISLVAVSLFSIYAGMEKTSLAKTTSPKRSGNSALPQLSRYSTAD